MSSSRFHVTFTPSLHITLLALCATILFFTLGMWQLQRADEKKIREKEAATQEQKHPEPFQARPKQYQRLQIKGRYLEQTLLLDNQHEQHQLGYHVLTPFLLTDNTLLIVDRGWIPKPATQQQGCTKNCLKMPTCPSLSTASMDPADKPREEDLAVNCQQPLETITTITGQAYYPSTKQWVLGESLDIRTSKLAIVQTLDSKLFKRFLQKSVYPFIIRLDAQEKHGFIRHWIVNNMPWQRHIAYAIQWFVFGVIVILLYLVRNINYEKK